MSCPCPVSNMLGRSVAFATINGHGTSAHGESGSINTLKATFNTVVNMYSVSVYCRAQTHQLPRHETACSSSCSNSTLIASNNLIRGTSRLVCL